MPFPRRIAFGLAALATIMAIGVTGYMLIEGWSFVDALFMTVIPLTTVGYYEIHPLSQAGRNLAQAREQAGGAVILAIKKKTGQLVTNPSRNVRPGGLLIEVGDQLVVMGTREQLNALECTL